MDLRNLLEQENPDLYRYVMDVRAAVEPILEWPAHPYYTDHSLRHSERVIEKLNGLTEALMKDPDHRLSTTEIYVLLAAAYLHDIGMQDQRHTKDMEWIREHHHELTREMIFEYLEQRNKFIKLGLPRISIIDRVVALVAEAHREVNLFQDSLDEFVHNTEVTYNIETIIRTETTRHGETVKYTEKIYNTETKYTTETIRPRLLAALLRFADELDIDHRRVNMDRLKLMQAPIDSYLHWYLCHYVSDVRIENEYITICYRFPKECSHYEVLITLLVERKIRDELKELKDIFRRNGVKSDVSRCLEVQYHRDLDPLPPEVEERAEAKKTRWYQEEIERLNQEMVRSRPAPLDLEIIDA